jgi:hypothetical protein
MEPFLALRPAACAFPIFDLSRKDRRSAEIMNVLCETGGWVISLTQCHD